MKFYFKKDWIYIDWRKYLYIDISNPKKTINKIKGVFKPLTLYFRFVKNMYTPYPVLWVSKPAFIQIMAHDVGWKDKYDSPQYETSPYVWVHIYKFNFVWYWGLPLHRKDKFINDYWEQALWYLKYYKNDSYGRLDKPDIERAKESWPWENCYTKESSWDDSFLLK